MSLARGETLPFSVQTVGDRHNCCVTVQLCDAICSVITVVPKYNSCNDHLRFALKMTKFDLLPIVLYSSRMQ